MKKIEKLLEQLRDLMQEEVEKRTEFFDNRSEAWQESERRRIPGIN